MKNKLNKLSIKLGQMILNGDLKKKKGDQTILVVLGLCVVGVFLLMIFKGGAENIVNDLTKQVGEKIKQVFTGM